jgi:hypothetical protein
VGHVRTPRWLTGFVDSPEPATSAEFWAAVTGFALSPWRHGTFATLVPPEADAYLRLQRFPVERVHLDLHVDDIDAGVQRATRLGATLVERPGHAILRSPGGFVLCLVPCEGEGRRPRPVRWGGHTSVVDQVALDIPAAAWASECRFWADLLDWPVRTLADPEFDRLEVPPSQPLRILLQRLDDADGPVRAHLDLATDDRAAEVARHAALGATVVAERHGWTVLRAPTGAVYCVTDRDPATGAPR